MPKEFNMEEIHQFSTQSACLQNVSLSEIEGRGAKKKSNSQSETEKGLVILTAKEDLEISLG